MSGSLKQKETFPYADVFGGSASAAHRRTKGNSHLEAKAKTDKENIFDFSAPWRSLLPQHGSRLTRISTNLNRASMGIKALGQLCTRGDAASFCFSNRSICEGQKKAVQITETSNYALLFHLQ